METEATFIFKGFNIVLYGKFIPYSVILFSLFLSGLPIVQGIFSFTFSVSKLYELSLWILEHIWEMSSNVSIHSYLSPFGIAIYENFYLYCFLPSQTFFWSVNCKNLVYKLCITFWKCQNTQTLFILECI